MKTDPAFWKEKAAQFEKLHDPQHRIGGEYDPAGHLMQVTDDWVDAHALGCWVLSGGNPSVIEEFKSLAAVAAVALDCLDDPEAWTYWLDHLRRQSADFSSEGYEVESASSWPLLPAAGQEHVLGAERKSPSGVDTSGVIPSVCEASARFCRVLANESEKVTIARELKYRTAFARNVDRLRTECGWTYEQLAEEIKLDRTSVIDHVTKGAQPRVQTKKAYADAFTRRLGRSISVNDLDADLA